MNDEEDESYADREEMVIAIMHLLAIVFTKISTQILRLKFSTVSQTLHQTIKSFASSSAVTRDTLSCLECVLLAMDLATWTQSTTAMVGRPAVLKGLTTSVLQLTLDERPKVRKRAQDVVRKVLSFPPTPALVHPFMIVVVEHFCGVLSNAAASALAAGAGSKKGKNVKPVASEGEGVLLDVLVFLKGLGPLLGGKVGGGDDKVRAAVGILCNSVLEIGEAAGGNIVLSQWIFQVLTAVMTPQIKKTAPPNISLQTAHTILSKALSSLRPYHNDSTLAPVWLGLVDTSFSCTALIIERDIHDNDNEEAKKYASTAYAELILEFFTKDFSALLAVSNGKRAIIEKAVEAYAGVVQHGILEFMVESTIVRKGGASIWAQTLSKILDVLKNAIQGISYKENWGAILIIIESALERIGGTSPNMVDPIVATLISIRDSPNYSDDYPFKSELDSALEAAALAMGLERFTIVAPLNIFDVEESETKRPYLLSVFTRAMNRPALPSKSKFGPANLNYFTETILPLYSALHQRSADLKAKGLAQPSKLFDILASQAFGLFPAICSTSPSDLAETFDSLSPELLSLLQSQTEELEANEEGVLTENDMRPLIYSGLQSLVEGYTAITSNLSDALAMVDDDDESPEVAQQKDDLEVAGQGLHRISAAVNKYLTILCTIYTTPPDWILKTGENKGSVLQGLHDRGQNALEGCIKALMSIADSKAVTGYFFQLVKNILQIQTSVKEHEAMDGMDDEAKSEAIAEVAIMGLKVYAMLDLLCVLLVFLPEVKAMLEASEEDAADFQVPSDSPLHLFYRLLSGQLRDRDATLQKKTYKALNLVMAVLPASQTPFKDLMPKLIDPEVISRTTSGVKRARMGLIQAVVEACALKKSEEDGDDEDAMLLEFIPVVLSEVMLTTKEASEKARSAAYECLIGMGRKMLDVGIRRARDAEWAGIRKKLKGEDADEMDEEEEREINFREYMMMVVAGLAGASSTMQSAAIACCGRLVFEFNDAMGEELVKEIVSTILLFMSSNNREIVKAALGFIKVVVVSVPQELLEDELENMITNMMTMSKPHKSHFKTKIRNVLERLIRKFSFEVVEGFIPTDDAKLIRNIRKVRERQLKKKAAAKQAKEDGSDGEKDGIDAIKGKKKLQSRQKEFEDVLHGSDDEEDDDDDDDAQYLPEQFRDAVHKKTVPGAKSMIREGEDIVDFLDSQVISRVTTAKGGSSSSTSGSSKRKRGTEFDMNEDGRLMIAESDEEASSAIKNLNTNEEQEDYYKEAITGEGAYKRLPDGSVKFVNKRKRGEEEDIIAKTDRLNAGASNIGGRWGAKFERKKPTGMDEATKAKMLGAEYRSKKAKGDVKKAGMPDPYAYIPLSGKIVGSKKKSTELSKDFKDVIKASVNRSDVRAGKQQGGRQGPRGVKKSNKKHK
ncbi:hypothetical protein BCR33DRAFT_700085 [Rhizoclosmatium globosum]|uniref:Uncharacterized protein n=1 Tax=Rhizoclosmatium globosum TaxID=329046 RepID=A0A1Y2BXI0_9FUNG|nr:hypothetical protein BCR33DRAFT_700085 [Rhizoclosmatium globosum]|eukprot:ORY39357.1 hypothetical protein BCR33DRAFT_700085 [Rhizoclosmatium globosum]